MKKGAIRYGDRNWEKGQPNEVYLESLSRHFMALEQAIVKGERPTPEHLGGVAFNIMGLIRNDIREHDMQAWKEHGLDKET